MDALGELTANSSLFRVSEITITGPFAPGDRVVIDSRNMVLTHNGQNALHKMGGGFFDLILGNNEMPHTHEIPAYTHDIEYGIFKGPTPQSVTVKVDGVTIPGLPAMADDVYIILYLLKDSGGKVARGTWHNRNRPKWFGANRRFYMLN